MKETKSKRPILGPAFKSIDIFGQYISFRQSGQNRLTSYFGALLTIIILLIVVFYGWTKFDDMVTHSSSSHETLDEKSTQLGDLHNYDKTEFYPGAFSITLPEGGSGVRLEDVMTIKAQMVNWDNEDVTEEDVSVRKCEVSDYFHHFSKAPNGYSKSQLEEYFLGEEMNNLFCFQDPNQLKFKGTYRGQVASNLRISATWCG